MNSSIGCGKFDEIKMLKYIEGSLIDKSEIEEHLAGCDICLKDIIDLNRINSVMEAGNALPVRKSNFISIWLKNGIVDKIISTIDLINEQPLTVTRKADGNKGQKDKYPVSKNSQIEGMQNILIFNFDSIPALIKIIPAGEGLFWISVESDILKGHSIELKKKDDKIPVYSKKSGLSEVLIKGITEGEYEILFAGETINIGIKNSDYRTGE